MLHIYAMARWKRFKQNWRQFWCPHNWRIDRHNPKREYCARCHKVREIE